MHASRIFVSALILLACFTFGPSGCDPNWEWPNGAPCDETLPDGVPDSCPDPDAEDGTNQGDCRAYDPEPCDAGLSCITGVCLPCGGDGELCCYNGINVADSCDPGNACVDTLDGIEEQWGKCTSTCGSPGKPCCDQDYNPCPGGGLCNSDDMCEGDESNGCGVGNPHFVYFIDSSSCATTWVEYLATEGNEQFCAELLLPAGHTLGPIDANPTCSDVCIVPSINQPSDMDLCWFTDQDYNTCAGSFCVLDDECTWSQNECP